MYYLDQTRVQRQRVPIEEGESQIHTWSGPIVSAEQKNQGKGQRVGVLKEDWERAEVDREEESDFIIGGQEQEI